MPNLTRSLTLLAAYPGRRWLASRPPDGTATVAPTAAIYLVATDGETARAGTKGPKRDPKRRATKNS